MEPAPPRSPRPELLPMACEEASPPDAEGSEVLVTDFRNLTLNPAALLPSPPPEGSPQRRGRSDRSLRLAAPPTRRRGVRTVLSVRRERMARMLMNAKYSLFVRGALKEQGAKSQPKGTAFKCPCSFCITRAWDPSENARIGSNYNTELA